MANVKVYRDERGRSRIEINGMDFTNEVYADSFRVSSTGPDDGGEVCLDLKVALSRLDIGDHEDVDAALLVGSSLVRMARVREAS